MDTHDQLDEELIEKLAAIEHERWADWQKWMHSLMFTVSGSKDSEDVKAIPYDTYIRWENQIATKYEDLTEAEKQSDREQVDRYLPIIEAYYQQRIREAIEKATETTIQENNDILEGKLPHFFIDTALGIVAMTLSKNILKELGLDQGGSNE